MIVKLLTEQHLEFLSLKGGCTGSSESTLVKMPHCWNSHVAAHLGFVVRFLIACSVQFCDTFAEHQMGLDATQPVFGVSDKARLKPVCSATETS